MHTTSKDGRLRPGYERQGACHDVESGVLGAAVGKAEVAFWTWVIF